MKHHGSDLRFCSCEGCRQCKRHKHGSDEILAVRRRSRRAVKRALRLGQYDVSARVSVPFLW